MLAKVEGYFHEAGAETTVISGVEPDPSFETVMRGAQENAGFGPDLIVGQARISNGCCKSNVDSSHEHPELKTNGICIFLQMNFKTARKSKILCCIPSTSGTASEVSQSSLFLQTKQGLKHGLGNMWK